MVARLVLAHGTLFFGVGAHVPPFFGTLARAVGALSYTCIGVGGERRDESAQLSTYLQKSKQHRSARLQVLLHFPVVSFARRGGQCLSA